MALISLGIITIDTYGIQQGEAVRENRILGKYFLTTFDKQTDENLANIYLDTQAVRQKGAEILRKYKLNVFYNQDSLSPPSIMVKEVLLLPGFYYWQSPAYRNYFVYRCEQRKNIYNRWLGG